MNKFFTLLRQGAVALLLTILLGSCLKDKFTKTFTYYEAIYATRQQVLASVKSDAPQEISSPGKIYMYGKYIFLNEFNKVVHIIDNSNPVSPRNIGFINIPGNADIAVKGNMMYADMYADLLTIDISDPANTKLVHSIPKLFPERLYGVGFSLDTSRIVVGWTKRDTTVDVSDQISPVCRNCMYESEYLTLSDNSMSQGRPGVGGSLARFSIVSDYMYVVGQADLTVLSLANATAPEKIGVEPVSMNIETIFPFKDKLFIGSTMGMFVYNISDPLKPVRESAFEHARACDPVVADDKYAFVTLRTGNTCGGNLNILEVVDVSDVTAPVLTKTYNMTNPHGLAKDENFVFVCDGTDGLKMFDASDVFSLKTLDHIKDINTYDVIAFNKKLMVVTDAGLNQYDYSDGKKMKFLSTIRVTKKS